MKEGFGMKLPHGMTTQAIRLMQEFKRSKVEELAADAISEIQHPAGSKDDPAQMLVEKGFIAATESGFALTEQGKAFLEKDPVP